MTLYGSTVAVVNPDGTDLSSRTTTVAGAVSVSNLPGTQPVSGSVSVSNLPATQPVSGSVSVSNLPATQPVSGSVSVSNFPTLQTVGGTVTVSNFPTSTATTQAAPASSSILASSATSSGTLFTVPAGRVWKGSVALSAAVTVLGSANCVITQGGTAVLNLMCSGLALATVTNAVSMSDVYVYGGASGTAVAFVAGSSGSSSGSASGVLL